jgi:hypothetical protein
MSQEYPSFSVVNLPLNVLQVVVLLSSVLMNGAEVNTLRILLLLLLLAPVSASNLIICSSWWKISLVDHHQRSGCLFVDEMLLLP